VSGVEIVDGGTGEIVRVVPAAAPELKFSYTPAQAKAWMAELMEMRRAVLTENVDYGVIPGTEGYYTLLKPGAEKLLLAAGLRFTTERIGGSREEGGVYYKATIYRGDTAGEVVVAECEGYAGYDESRYYVSAADNTAKEKYWAQKDRRAERPEKMVEYRAPWNTLVKMAQVRALKGATLNALAASGLFAAEAGDTEESGVPDGWTPADPRDIADVRTRIAALSEAARAELAERWKVPGPEGWVLPPLDRILVNHLPRALDLVAQVEGEVRAGRHAAQGSANEGPTAATPPAADASNDDEAGEPF